MAKATVTISDVSGTIVPEDEGVRLVIRHHPVLDEIVELDASLEDVKPMLATTGQYIFIEVHMPDGEIKSAVVEVATFDAAFKGDVYQALKDANRVEAPKPRSNGNRGNAEELQKIREWAAANGHTVAAKGRVAANIVEAYRAANPAES